MTQIVYSGGCGRSGRTLLEYLLTASPDVVTCGEVITCAGGLPTTRCSCSADRNDFAIWSDLFDDPQPTRRDHKSLTLRLLERVVGNYAVLVGSAKTA